MNNCELLKRRRKEERLSQTNLAKMLGMSCKTIVALEKDETRWRAMHAVTVDKINSFLDGSYKENVNSVNEEPAHKPAVVVVCDIPKNDNTLSKQDKKTLTLVEFAYEGLTESTNHNEFVANLKLLKRILDKY